MSEDKLSNLFKFGSFRPNLEDTPLSFPVNSDDKSQILGDSLLQAFLQRPISLIKRSLYYRNKTIEVDSYTFQNCRFDNCELITRRGNFKFINCVIDGSTIISYQEAKKGTVLF